jgi:hypothetical protein
MSPMTCTSSGEELLWESVWDIRDIKSNVMIGGAAAGDKSSQRGAGNPLSFILREWLLLFDDCQTYNSRCLVEGEDVSAGLCKPNNFGVSNQRVFSR